MASCDTEMRQACYMLPVEMIRNIKRAAADNDVYPAKIVEWACGEYLANRPARAKASATA